MYRWTIPSETHNKFQANPPHEPQFEGVVWSDGTCTVRWLTVNGSTEVWASFDDLMAVHGHPEYGSQIEWHEVGSHRNVNRTG